ncbi:hypothetical protein C3408_17045 [Candidatus Pantoea alvi]|uniref:hypothetical protein n=1 Tax=Enterobacter agglomerans TaxID=549 RepID=UPI000CDE5288|nr:hypothetical protein [Pantoea agglomerans]POW55612.1 hypothetical protein C3408_17045 [Pantoea alvi]UBN52253.1 hypothetical protein LB453_01405 [Pantoea agglomerans]
MTGKAESLHQRPVTSVAVVQPGPAVYSAAVALVRPPPDQSKLIEIISVNPPAAAQADSAVRGMFFIILQGVLETALSTLLAPDLNSAHRETPSRLIKLWANPGTFRQLSQQPGKLTFRPSDLPLHQATAALRRLAGKNFNLTY